MATKKIRLIDEEPATTETASTDAPAPQMDSGQTEKLLKYAEQIDWKLWEILKILRAQAEENNK